jgi:hypothetical protein
LVPYPVNKCTECLHLYKILGQPNKGSGANCSVAEKTLAWTCDLIWSWLSAGNGIP